MDTKSKITIQPPSTSNKTRIEVIQVFNVILFQTNVESEKF